MKVATDYPLVDQLLTSPNFDVSNRADEASADVLVSLHSIRDFYGLPRSACSAAQSLSDAYLPDGTNGCKMSGPHQAYSWQFSLRDSSVAEY